MVGWVCKMIISIDFDGIIADTNLVKKEYALTKFGLNVPKHACDKTSFSLYFGGKKYKQMTRELYTHTITRITPAVPGAINGIKTLSKNHKLLLLSDRAKERLGWAKEWLGRRGLLTCFDSVISSHQSGKHKICLNAKCHVLIDDDCRHLSESGKGYKRILFKPGGHIAQAISEGVFLVKSWKQILLIINKLRFSL